MKFQIHADLEQEEQEISNKLSEFVKDEVTKKIEAALEKRMTTLDKTISAQIDKNIDSALEKNITGCIDEHLDEPRFQRIINKTITEAFKKLEAKYDIDFATKIIEKMREK